MKENTEAFQASEVYTEDELGEILSYMRKSEQGLLVMLLLGRDHFTTRKIRNAYLPMITSFVEVGGEDLTHTLFDGEEDAVDQIERLVTGDNTDR